jgi:hypothetical protein
MLDSPQWQGPAAEFVAPILGQIAGGAAKAHGSFLTFEFGSPSLVVHDHPWRNRRSAYARGASSLWIYCCHWRITRTGEQLASSEHDAATIDRAVACHNGQRLDAIAVDPSNGRTHFHFDLGGALDTWPYGDDANEEQWGISTHDAVLRMNAASRYEIGPVDAPLSDDGWLPLF